MTRFLLQTVLPLLAPLGVYVLWVLISRRAREDGVLVAIAKGPWFWLVVAGFVLMGTTLGIMAALDSESPDGVYVPPRWEDGRVVPGRIVPPEAAPPTPR